MTQKLKVNVYALKNVVSNDTDNLTQDELQLLHDILNLEFDEVVVTLITNEPLRKRIKQRIIKLGNSIKKLFEKTCVCDKQIQA